MYIDFAGATFVVEGGYSRFSAGELQNLQCSRSESIHTPALVYFNFFFKLLEFPHLHIVYRFDVGASHGYTEEENSSQEIPCVSVSVQETPRFPASASTGKNHWLSGTIYHHASKTMVRPDRTITRRPARFDLRLNSNNNFAHPRSLLHGIHRKCSSLRPTLASESTTAQISSKKSEVLHTQTRTKKI